LILVTKKIRKSEWYTSHSLFWLLHYRQSLRQLERYMRLCLTIRCLFDYGLTPNTTILYTIRAYLRERWRRRQRTRKRIQSEYERESFYYEGYITQEWYRTRTTSYKFDIFQWWHRTRMISYKDTRMILSKNKNTQGHNIQHLCAYWYNTIWNHSVTFLKKPFLRTLYIENCRYAKKQTKQYLNLENKCNR
jgi:hypothetical protein